MGKETLCNIDGMLHFKKEDRSSSEIADEDEKLLRLKGNSTIQKLRNSGRDIHIPEPWRLI